MAYGANLCSHGGITLLFVAMLFIAIISRASPSASRHHMCPHFNMSAIKWCPPIGVEAPSRQQSQRLGF
jgi:hypothetical protein